MNYKFKKVKDEDNEINNEIKKLTELLKQSLKQIGINDIASIISKKNGDNFDLSIKVTLKEKCPFERDKLIKLLYKTPFSHQTTEKDIYYWDSTYFDDEGTNKIIAFGLEENDKYIDEFDFDNDDNNGNGYFDDDDNWYPDYETYSNYNDSKPIKDSKQVNDNVITLLNQLQSSLKGAYNLASGLKQQLPQQQPTTNEEKALYNGKVITSLENIADSVSRWYKEIEQYKKEFAKAHIVIEEVIESFPLEARTKLRESEDPEQTYKELIEDLKNRYNSLPEKEKYKNQVLKMKKDLDGFYKNTFKK